MSEITKTFDKALKEQIYDTFDKVPFVQLIGMELVELEIGEAKIKLDMRDELRQPYGLLHGGATASLIDTATAFAILGNLAEGEMASTVDLTIQYLRPHTAGAISCTAKVTRAGKRLLFVSAEVENEAGKLVATALSTYSKV
ncbi:MAG: PaaI family thioesterase [Actinomycetota bacterium]